jgi:hypothetical protein
MVAQSRFDPVHRCCYSPHQMDSERRPRTTWRPKTHAEKTNRIGLFAAAEKPTEQAHLCIDAQNNTCVNRPMTQHHSRNKHVGDARHACVSSWLFSLLWIPRHAHEFAGCLCAANFQHLCWGDVQAQRARVCLYVCFYMCVCVCASKHVCMCMYAHVCACACVRACVPICSCVCVFGSSSSSSPSLP